ncbi:APC family permease [Ktedonosporobacter rubrisoli]|uniref:APC family permease n=1 Tax=Ktedonosporobacter rubrisoli TaxID=2509675 RepID=A0A4P6JT62_KTERU|nr:APC family permease [Ktedonosporobacter rubrisoli]QBD78076.1 APC family permease [Ktedonosporobacter rubrisoli]
MTQDSVTHVTANNAHEDEHAQGKGSLGPILCWAVVFADIGTSVYYTPGILFQSVQGLAGFFVFLTMAVFVLLTLKYAEVTHRFPQGGGVVTVAGQALNPWFGALGGMFILVDYFLTAAISSLSGLTYFSVVFPAIGPYVLWITIGIIILLGILNWIGISESAKVSLAGAVIAFISDLAILFTVFTHLSFSQFLVLIEKMFASHALTPEALLAGFAGSFLAFSGLESISQLSPVMRAPRKKTASWALFFVVITIGITSPLLTILSTNLLPVAAADPVKSQQIISLLAGHWGNIVLQTEVAISASALLVFACNTAIIGSYHVFMALSRMEFLPSFILDRNKLRGTPHYSIALATGIPVAVLIIVWGNINILGDMYAFGLLGAFTLTCLSLDIVRTREWRKALRILHHKQQDGNLASEERNAARELTSLHDLQASDTPDPAKETAPAPNGLAPIGGGMSVVQKTRGLWFKIDFSLGVLTTLLVAVAWSTNLVTKPLATVFGGSVALLGMVIAYINYRSSQKSGRVPVPVVVRRVEERLPDCVLAVLLAKSKNNDAIIRAAINDSEESRPVVFLYIGEHKPRETAPRMMEIVDPYLEDQKAKESFGKAESLAIKTKVPTRRYIYLQAQPDIVAQVWQKLRPRDTIIAAEDNEQFQDINPDRIRYETTPEGKVAHLLKRW